LRGEGLHGLLVKKGSHHLGEIDIRGKYSEEKKIFPKFRALFVAWGGGGANYYDRQGV